MASRPTNLPVILLQQPIVILPGVVIALGPSLLRAENSALVSSLMKATSSSSSPVTNSHSALDSWNKQLVACFTLLNPEGDSLERDKSKDKTSKPLLITDGKTPSTSLDQESGDKAIINKDDSSVPFYSVGCLARIVRIERSLSGGVQVILEGLSRISFRSVTQRAPYFVVDVVHVKEAVLESSDVSTYTLVAQFKRLARELVSFLKSGSFTPSPNSIPNPNPNPNASTTPTPLVGASARAVRRLEGLVNHSSFQEALKVADLLVFTLDVSVQDKIDLLSLTQSTERLGKAIELLSQQINMIKISQKINTSVDTNLNKKQRDFLLRQQLKAIRQELGEQDGDDADDDGELVDLQAKLAAAQFGPDADRIVQRELKRLKRMHPTQAEYQVCRTYLETLSEIPWRTATDDKIDGNAIRAAKSQLDRDHYGLDAVKRRLLEYLAVIRLKSRGQQTSVIEKAPILLLVGPPGVGKTSLAKSVATALGRKFHRISLGGVRDEAEIRGHRRTYVGAMPGLIVQGYRKVGVVNPVMLLDEIDKLGATDFHGDPSAAMLEVLDPEQNHAFNDHYLGGITMDLSKTLFIATANTLDTIPAPLRDRMEIIELSGYTYLEKKHIAQQYLVPKQAIANGLSPEMVQVTDEALLKIATGYTRESGVRSLEREIATVCRGKAVEYANILGEEGDEDKDMKMLEEYNPVVQEGDVERYLGVEKYDTELVNDGNAPGGSTLAPPGVVTGLAYMGSGNGGILLIEATKYANGTGVERSGGQGVGGGGLQLTGNLGGVIKESATLAVTWVRAHSVELGLVNSALASPLAGYDVHIHAPAGAIPKDGPSAGVAMTVAIVSLLSNRSVAADVAMTGEMTLRGAVLAVGGIREKVLAAHRAGVRRVLLPLRNRKDVEKDDMPEDVRAELTFVYLVSIWDALTEIWPETASQRPVAMVESRL
ncbi:Lon protease C-terminal proteolytic domain-containing protein [Lipomyces oligophaga]|uniref:Lon protease C-terminal proteolytic domain-containing protein n=1 Tax=Lipomyces oligophaga TaxID=45792 RepID=UPI0034CE489F